MVSIAIMMPKRLSEGTIIKHKNPQSPMPVTSLIPKKVFVKIDLVLPRFESK